MKIAVKLTPDQRKIIVVLDKLAGQLSSLLDYVRGLENDAAKAGNEDRAHQLAEYELQITRLLSDVQGDALQIIDDSPQLANALEQLGRANKQIDDAIKKTAALDASLKQIGTILNLVSTGLSIFAGL